MLTQEQILAAQKANLETLFGLTQKAIEGLEKMVELNVQVTKAAFDSSAHNLQSAMTAKDMQELLTLQASMLQPLAEKTAAYSRHLYDIASQTASSFQQVSESKTTEAQQSLVNVMDNMVKNAPAGSEAAMAMIKNSLSTATQAMESVQRAVKQAGELAETNFKAFANSAMTAAQTTTKKR